MRPGETAPELLMTERAAGMAFAAGALVFPGGRIDPDDVVVGGLERAAQVASVRETIEETGVAPALTPVSDAAVIAQLRRELDDGVPFSALLDAFGLTIDFDALTPFARWCPTFKETRRFDTLFFVAEAPPGAQIGATPATEAVRACWIRAAAALADADRGAARLIFPTRRNLERLARFESIDDARADAACFPVRTIVPWIEERAGERWLCIPEDAGYPVTAERLETARRS